MTQEREPTLHEQQSSTLARLEEIAAGQPTAADAYAQQFLDPATALALAHAKLQLVNAANASYEAHMMDYSTASIERARQRTQHAREHLECLLGAWLGWQVKLGGRTR